MKIVFLAAQLSRFGGIEQYNLQTIKALRELGHQVKPVELKGKGFLAKAGFSLSYLAKVLVWRPDLVMCAHINFSSLALLTKNILSTPYTLALYGYDALNLQEAQKNRVCQATDLILLFDWTKKKLLAQVPEVEEKISFIMSTVSDSEFMPQPKSQELLVRYGLHGKKIIMSMSRISREEAQMGLKGYGRVFQALPKILKEIPEARYLLVGGGDYLEETRARVKTMGLEDYVIMPGAISNEERGGHYNLADVFILPSKDEGSPAVVLLEAMFCAKPVITGNRECRPQDLCSGQLGLLIDPDNIDQIAGSVIAVLSGQEPKLKGIELREKALAMYGPERFKRDVAQLFAQTRG